MADLNATVFRRTFHYHGFIAVSDLTTPNPEEQGRADVKLLARGKSVCVELKADRFGYEFDLWKANQREWARDYCMNWPFQTEYWLGIHILPYSNKTISETKFAPAWLVPYHKMLEVEALVRPIQGRLPYDATTHRNKALRANDTRGPLDAIRLLAGYELTWHKPKTLAKPAWIKSDHEFYQFTFWTIPSSHPFYSKYIGDLSNVGDKQADNRGAHPVAEDPRVGHQITPGEMGKRKSGTRVQSDRPF